MENKLDITALGELLIDFAPMGDKCYQANAGGAPANVLAAAAKLGKSTAFIGMVGNDNFGHMLKDDIEAAHICSTGLRFTERACTTLAFVHLNEQGDRSFTFFRRPGADMMLTKDDVDYTLIDEASIFHYGSVSMTMEPARTATLSAAQYARQKGKRVSYDPNLRPLLWNDIDEARDIILTGMEYCDILKISEEEMEFLIGSKDLEKGSEELMRRYNIRYIFITCGPQGCFYRANSGFGHVPAYDIPVLDTTGAGDAFLGGVLSQLCALDEDEFKSLPRPKLTSVAAFGNAVGSLATTKKGAIPAMPTLEQVKQCMEHVKQKN